MDEETPPPAALGVYGGRASKQGVRVLAY